MSSPDSPSPAGAEPPLEARVLSALTAWLGAETASRARLLRLTGDASNRIYVRAALPEPAPRAAGGSTAMAMVLPWEERPAEEFGSGPGHGQLPFVEMAAWLAGRGLPVPAIFHLDPAQRVLLLEDLGDVTLERALHPGNRLSAYRQAVGLLVEFQRRTTDPEPTLVASRRHMDRAVLRWELDHYVEWRLLADLGVSPGPWQEALGQAFEALLDELCALPVRLIHRDFQSRNLMLDPAGRMSLIDFQDALMGPFIYDLVALLRDSYVVLSPAELASLLDDYEAQANQAGVAPSGVDLRRAFHLQTVQRKLKDTGRFVFIDRVKKNPSFLPYRAPSMGYVRQALLALDEGERLRSLLAELDPE